MKRLTFAFLWLSIGLLCNSATPAEQLASITITENAWTLRNESLQTTVSFANGKLRMDTFENLAAHTDYLEGQAGAPLFTHQINGATVAADDGGWMLDGAETKDIELYGEKWGKRLEITISRTIPVAFTIRQVFEIFNGKAALRCQSFLKNGTQENVAITASDILNVSLPDRPHTLYSIEGILNWQASNGGLSNGGRNAMVHYTSGDGWFVLPENNWATCLESGASKAHSRDKLLGIFLWNGEKTMRVATNPKAVQLVLFPHEEVEYFAINLGVFTRDVLDGRMAAAEHLRRRYKYTGPMHVLSVNDWQWGAQGGKRTDTDYRNTAIPKAKAAGFDRMHIDDFWYDPEDGVDPKGSWTDMPALCDLIVANGMKPGHWFSLQGRICTRGWGEGRDCADPANVDFKLKQTQDTLIAKYHAAWGQVDAGLLWKTDEETAYSHPSDSVYRKILGMRRYMNTIAHQDPNFIMHSTCEVDNPAGPGSADSHGNQNVGLIHMPDNGVAGMFRRTEYGDDVRDVLAAVGMFPPEGMISMWGGDGNAETAWKDSPLWYYQFLLARHTSIYSWPGNWSEESVSHLRLFNDWRKNPRIQSVLNELLRPVYNGTDWLKNEGPWAWMFTDELRTKALLIAINHLQLSKQNSFAAKLRWLDGGKNYLIEEITQLPTGNFGYAYRGEFTGMQLKTEGLPIDLDASIEPCAAFWIQEKVSSNPQVLYADAAVIGYSEKSSATELTVQLEGQPNAAARLIIFKPGKNGVENRIVLLDSQGRATVSFDATTITGPPQTRE